MVEIGKDARESDTAAEKPHSHRKKSDKKRKSRSFWKELPILIGVAIVLTIIIQTFIGRPYLIPSGSMETTLHGCPGCVGDRILVDKLVYDFSDPEPGEVVVFRAPPGWQGEETYEHTSNPVLRYIKEIGSSIGLAPPQEYDLVKRVVAVGGQTISYTDDGHITVDGRKIDEPYARRAGQPAGISRLHSAKVPMGSVFVMGDNRNNSADSRFQNGGGAGGAVPVDDIIGKARLIIWPIGRWSVLDGSNPQDTATAAPAARTGPPTEPGIAVVVPVLALALRRRISPAGTRPPR